MPASWLLLCSSRFCAASSRSDILLKAPESSPISSGASATRTVTSPSEMRRTALTRECTGSIILPAA